MKKPFLFISLAIVLAVTSACILIFSLKNCSKEEQTTASYKVEYYLENISDDNYTLSDTESKTGTIDQEASVSAKAIEHFTFNKDHDGNVLSANIDGDGSTILKLYYTRNEYSVSVVGNNAKAGTFIDVSGDYKYGTEIDLSATTNQGYVFNGWKSGEDLVEDKDVTFTVEKDVTYTATWSANTNTPYKIEYYFENIEDGGYTLHETINKTGTTDEKASVTASTFSYFKFNENHVDNVLIANIEGDGSTILKLYYTRKVYTLYSAGSNHCKVTNTGSHKYGERIISTVTTTLGYEFLGWYCGDEQLSTDTTYDFVIDKNVTAKFKMVDGMERFDFFSTETSCMVVGLKDEYSTEAIIPNCVTSISGQAFSGCSNLTEVVIGSGVTDIGERAFYSCMNLTGIQVKSSNTAYKSIDGNLYSVDGNRLIQYAIGKEQTIFSIPEGVKSIDGYACAFSYKLNGVIIPDGVENIGKFVFYDCEELNIYCYSTKQSGWENEWHAYNSVAYLPVEWGINVDKFVEADGLILGLDFTYNSATVVRQSKRITSATIPLTVTYNESVYNVTHLGVGAFENCTNLVSVTLGGDIRNLSSNAFTNCVNLTSIVIPEIVEDVNYPAFEGCVNLTIFCKAASQPASWTSDWNVLDFGNNQYVPVVWDCENNYTVENGDVFVTANGIEYAIIGDKAVVVKQSADITSAHILATVYCQGQFYSVTEIGESAFDGCGNLTSVTIPNSVTVIANWAFNDCNELREIVLPENLMEIGAYAFSGIGNMESIIIPESVTIVGDSAFMYSTNLTIYCRAADKPSGFNDNWNPDDCTVVWGYQG